MAKAKRRDNSAVYARRNQLARQAGWKSYSQERYAKEKLKQQSVDVQGKWGRFLFRNPQLTREEQRKAFRAFWKGLIDKRTRDDTSRGSPKAEWFVEYDKKVTDYDEWEEKYA
jgi:hypothetical protein